jgi:mycothiol system anti-sigma-R factor
MNTCDKHNGNILRYLDNELSGPELQDFRTHLASCSSCKTHLEEERELSRLFQRSRPLYSAPTALRARVSAAVMQESSLTNDAPEQSRKGGFQFPKNLPSILQLPWSLSWKLAPALLVVVVCLLFVPSGIRQVHAADYVETAVATHSSYVNGNLPLGIETDSPDAVAAWISDKVPFQFRLPSSDLTPQSKPVYQLTGASVVNYKGSPAALITYATKKEKISLLVTSSKSAVVAGGDEVRAGSLTFHYRSHHGYKVITWSSHDLSYALVSSVSGSARESCLVCHQSMADHDAFTPAR